jgi:hypothetical protein
VGRNLHEIRRIQPAQSSFFALVLLFVLASCAKPIRKISGTPEPIALDLLELAEYPPLPTPRQNPSAAIIDDVLYVVGGRIGDQAVDDVEALNLRTGQWAKKRKIPIKRFGSTACVVAGKLYLLGGSGGGKYAQRDVQEYDPHSNRWKIRAPMPQRWTASVCGEHAYRLYLIGGNDMGPWDERTLRQDPQKPFHQDLSPRIFDPVKNEWTAWEVPAQMRISGMRSIGAINQGRLYILSNDRRSDLLQILDLNSGEYDAFEFPQDIWRSSASGFIDGNLYALGASSFRYADQEHRADTVFGYDTRHKEYSENKPLAMARTDHAAATARGKIYIVGGVVRGSLSKAVEVYKPWKTIKVEPSKSGESDFALVVGVERYRNHQIAKYARRDAQAMRRLLEGRGVPASNVKILMDEKAGRADIAKVLEEWLPRNAGPTSRVYIYFAGHGITEPISGIQYLLPTDGDPAFLASSAIPLKGLIRALEQIPAKEVVAFVDACFSGPAARCVTPPKLRPLVAVTATPLRTHNNVHLMMATFPGGGAKIDEAVGQGSFTAELLRYFQGGNDSRLSPMTLNDLFEAVERGLGSEQRPQLISAGPEKVLFQ